MRPEVFCLMDGIHDLGGKHGYGQVIAEPDEPVFHDRWEASVFTMVNAAAAAGAFNNTDRFRHAIERIDPVAYLTHGYYGRWLGGLETLLVEAGIITRTELNERALSQGATVNDRIAARPKSAPDPMDTRTEVGSDRVLQTTARFKPGDQVLTATEVKSGHTRLPAYARGKQGVIHQAHGGWVYPDDSAHGRGESPQHLYTVGFTGDELWGGGDPNLMVFLDLFEPYLEQQ